MSRKENQDAYSFTTPIFHEKNYASWKFRMESYLMSPRLNVCNFVLVDYVDPKTPIIDANGKNIYGNNAKDKNSIPFSHNQSELEKVIHYNLAKEPRDKINKSHEGDGKVKKTNLQNFIMIFQSLRVNEEESTT